MQVHDSISKSRVYIPSLLPSLVLTGTRHLHVHDIHKHIERDTLGAVRRHLRVYCALTPRSRAQQWREAVGALTVKILAHQQQKHLAFS